MAQLIAAGTIALLAATPGVAADLNQLKPLDASRKSTLEVAVHRVYECQPGWWQTLNWGRVRPRYAARCYYRVVRR